MKQLHFDRGDSDVEMLLAAERDAPAEPQDLQNRILARAMLSLQHHATMPLEVLSPSPRRLSFGLAAAAVVLLTGLCAAAFVAGYKSRSENNASPGAEASSAPSGASPLVPVPSVVIALIPVPASATSAPNNAEAAVSTSRARQTQAERATSGVSSEAFAAELQVLQPARQAVARGEYSSALGIIAEHHRLFPHGVLTEEREALRVKALVGLGRAAEAERAGAAFRKRFPRSALVGRIDSLLGTRK